MSTATDTELSNEYLENLLANTARAALDGSLTDTDRVILLKLALSVAANEFHRIASNGVPDTITPEVLLLLQQIFLLCDDDVDIDKLLGGMGLERGEVTVAEEKEKQDSDGGVEDAG